VEGVRCDTTGSDLQTFTSCVGSCLDDFREVFEDEVLTLIAAAPNKSCELDPCPTWLVKQFAQHLAPVLTRLFNLSLHRVCR